MKTSDYLGEFKPWDSLTERERSFFDGHKYLPLSEAQAQRISILRGSKAQEFSRLVLYKVPGHSIAASAEFTNEEVVFLSDVWNDEQKVQEVREWLHKRSIPYSTNVYLVYPELVVATNWKIVVKYWDAFSWHVGVEMIVVDDTKQWVCSFHHEEVITFRSF